MTPINQETVHHILVVEDEPAVGLLLTHLLEEQGHLVTHVVDGMDALAAVSAARPDLIFLDLDLPRLGGFETCRQLKSDPATRFIPIVILTGQTSSEARVRAWELGADDFLTKPFQVVEVTARCRSLLRVKDLIDDLDGAQAVVFALARAMEAKNHYTQGHTERVTQFALALAARLELPPANQASLRRGAALHDIGKIAIPDDILNKPGALTREEFEVIKRHPVEGVRIVEPLRSVRDAVPLIRWHHERLDGRGYPDGLAGDAIPLLARILAIADIYDALSSARPYRAALPLEAALKILGEEAERGGLDSELVRCFCAAPPIPLASQEQAT